jgi:hypothetical protein
MKKVEHIISTLITIMLDSIWNPQYARDVFAYITYCLMRQTVRYPHLTNTQFDSWNQSRIHHYSINLEPRVYVHATYAPYTPHPYHRLPIVRNNNQLESLERQLERQRLRIDFFLSENQLTNYLLEYNRLIEPVTEPVIEPTVEPVTEPVIEPVDDDVVYDDVVTVQPEITSSVINGLNTVSTTSTRTAVTMTTVTNNTSVVTTTTSTTTTTIVNVITMSLYPAVLTVEADRTVTETVTDTLPVIHTGINTPVTMIDDLTHFDNLISGLVTCAICMSDCWNIPTNHIHTNPSRHPVCSDCQLLIEPDFERVLRCPLCREQFGTANYTPIYPHNIEYNSEDDDVIYDEQVYDNGLPFM